MDYIERPLKGGGFAYDFAIDQQLVYLLKYSDEARRQTYNTIQSWRTRVPHGKNNLARIFFDITDGEVFLRHPIFGRKARVTAEEAKRTSATAPIRMALLLYLDGFTVSDA